MVPVDEKLSAIAELLSVLIFDSVLDFLARQFHDNAVNLDVFFGSVDTGKYSGAFIYDFFGIRRLAIHLLTRKTTRTMMRIKTTVPPPMYMV